MMMKANKLPLPRNEQSSVKFDYDFWNFNGVNVAVLVCPKCSFQYLHQSTVTVFERGREDAPTTAIEVKGTAVQFRHDADRDNPSSRRDGVAIEFWCEGCDFVGELTIAQHKGNTIFDWREVPMRFAHAKAAMMRVVDE